MKTFTKVICFDSFLRIGRPILIMPGQVYRNNVAQCGPNEFVVFHNKDSTRLFRVERVRLGPALFAQRSRK